MHENENQLIAVDPQSLAQLGAISPALVVEQVRLVQSVMSSVMRRDEHYGKIPGTNKDCLYKSGAEKLCLTFQLTPEFVVEERKLDGGHRECVVTCHLSNSAGRRVGTGVGSCSTMESKYRYRGTELVATGEVVPRNFWDVRKSDPKKAQEMIGKGRTTKKDEDGVWRIYAKGEKSENPDIADVWNTVLKMAKKRAHVDATITTTACGDIFTQDVEDLPQYAEVFESSEPVAPPPPPASAPRQPPAPASQPSASQSGRSTSGPGRSTTSAARRPVQAPAQAPANVEEGEVVDLSQVQDPGPAATDPVQSAPPQEADEIDAEFDALVSEARSKVRNIPGEVRRAISSLAVQLNNKDPQQASAFKARYAVDRNSEDPEALRGHYRDLKTRLSG